MAQSQKSVRQSVSLSQAKEREKVAFFDLAERLARTPDRAEQQRLKEELGRMTFGEE
jgi:hypothetical protein